MNPYEIGAGYFKNADGTDGPGMAGFRGAGRRNPSFDAKTGIRLGSRVELADCTVDRVVLIHWGDRTVGLNTRIEVLIPMDDLTVLKEP